MKFFFLNEKTYKNNFYVDYYFKNLSFFFYKGLFGNNFLYFMDKYISEYLIGMITQFLSFFFMINSSLKNLNFNKILQIFLLVFIQIIAVAYL